MWSGFREISQYPNRISRPAVDVYRHGFNRVIISYANIFRSAFTYLTLGFRMLFIHDCYSFVSSLAIFSPSNWF